MLNFDDVKTLCKYCGIETKMRATLMCDACWALDRILNHVTPEARDAIFADHGLLVISDSLPSSPWTPPTDGEAA